MTSVDFSPKVMAGLDALPKMPSSQPDGVVSVFMLWWGKSQLSLTPNDTTNADLGVEVALAHR
jgi:hypothetical protein